MMWNPEIPTQFAVANDDDKNPSINIWDLRNPDYPVATFSDIHYGGLLGFSWCLSDPSLVVSSGKDNRTVVTNFKTGEQVLELPTQNRYSRVKWSHQLHGKMCAMSPEGTTSVLSFEPEGLYSNPERPYATPNISQQSNAPYVPKWVQPRCGARFGFGNKLVTFDSQSQGIVRVHQKGSNPGLVEKMQEFDKQLESLPPA
jgi:protein transport protein SEC31